MVLLITTLVIMVVLASLFGIGLGIANKVFAVKEDERVEEVEEILPGIDCGACGYGGCTAYAKAIVGSGVPVNMCKPGGEKIAAMIAAVLGIELEVRKPDKSVLLCNGKKMRNAVVYEGVKDCRAAELTGISITECRYGCLRLGTCVEECPFGAIVMVDNFPRVILEKCTGCGICAKVCPRGLYDVKPVTQHVFYRCKSEDKGAAAKRICPVACIACKKCELICPYEAVKVVDNLARIDYDKCSSCGLCVHECPTGVIHNYQNQRGKLWKEPTILGG